MKPGKYLAGKPAWSLRRIEALAVAAAMPLIPVLAAAWTLPGCAGGSGNREAWAHKVDVTADPWPDLLLLPGFGRKTAEKVVAARGADKALRDPRALLKAAGLSDGSVAELLPWIAFPREEGR